MSNLGAMKQDTYEDAVRFRGDMKHYSPMRDAILGLGFVMHRITKEDTRSDIDVAINEMVFEILLKDRTTNKNIIWASNDYSFLGELYIAEHEIMIPLITDYNADIIQSRSAKEYSKQNYRTKSKAEVFTPSWICNEQNNLIDEQWFGRKNVFNNQSYKSWQSNTEKIVFPETKGKTWMDYVDARRMEITCGEAPYLVSRYDTVTGKEIAISERIGLLDRKLRVVNENTNDFMEWIKWAERAYQSVYGYEYQGDNLLIARKNLLYTFIDNMRYKFKRVPTANELEKIATIISWNIWQMDGLTKAVPVCEEREFYEQMTLFEEQKERVFCKIKDWRSKKIVEYISLLEGCNGE